MHNVVQVMFIVDNILQIGVQCVTVWEIYRIYGGYG
jgi:hypothetical protein